MILSTIEQFKKHVNILTNVDFTEIKSHAETAELKYIKYFLGRDQYNDLITAAAGTPTAAQDALILKVEKIIANYAAFFWIPEANVQIGSDGITVGSENKRPASEARVDELKCSYANAGDIAIDECLLFLEENKADYPIWVGSDAYTYSEDLFIRNTPEFSNFYQLNHSRMAYLALRPTLKTLQKRRILPIIGKTMHDEIIAANKAETLTAEQKAVLDLAQGAMVYLSIAQNIFSLSIKVTGNGVTIYNESDKLKSKVKNTAELERLEKVKDEMLANGSAYLTDLEDAVADPDAEETDPISFAFGISRNNG